MAKAWFIEKKGKFYGPFSAEKVQKYAATGKISNETLVSDKRTGAGAAPYSEMAEIIAAPPETEPTQQPPPTAPTAAPPEDEAGEKWYVCTPEKRFGPYDVAHLENLFKEGKLNLDDRVQLDGSSQLREVKEAFPEFTKEKPKAEKPPVKPKPKADKPSPKPAPKARPKKPKAPPQEKKPGKGRLLMWVVLAIALFAVGFIGFVKIGSEEEIGKQTIFNKIKDKYEEVPTLKSKLRKMELPPFNDLVMSALEHGLNFKYNEVVDYHGEDAYKAEESVGAVRFKDLFGDKVRRELAYVVDGGYKYTYIQGFDGYITAVVIEHESWKRMKLSDYEPGDFATGARASQQAQRTVWSKEIIPEVTEASAYWIQGEGSQSYLNYIVVRNLDKE